MVFDYIDGAAGEGHAERRNRAALRDIELEPRVLVDVSKRDLGVPLFGERTLAPFGITPMGMCNLAAPGADLMLARMAARKKVPLGVSTVSSTSLERLIEAADGHAWFQLYFSGDGTGTMRLLERARDAGYGTLVFTLDVPEVGRRPRELRRGFTMPFRIGVPQFVDFALHPRWSLAQLAAGKPDMANFRAPGFTFDRTESRAAATFEHLARLRDAWPGRLVVKGVTHPDDAVRLRDSGVDAIQVSSHGGRQLDSGPAPIRALARIREAVGDALPLFFDSGLRSGEDVVKAYGEGADFVFLGRPLQFAIAARGERGLEEMWDVFERETSLTLAQIGRTSLPGGRQGYPLPMKPGKSVIPPST